MDILALLKKYGFSFSKKFGQNFITDYNLLCAIAEDAEVTSDDTVLEIGAGAGTLTRALGERAGRVFAFEIDRSLEGVLDETVGALDSVEVIMDDIQKWTDSELDALVGSNYKVVANLPYYITTPLLFMFLERKNPPKSITVMVQKEVAERICATEKKGDYGALSVSVALRANAKITRIVKRDMFTPPPNVDSAVVRIDMKQAVDFTDEKALFTLVKRAFAMKRKTLVNNLSAGYGKPKSEIESILTRLGFSPTIRAEQLAPNQFIELANELNKE
ncbi:MAG: ribosomal RNA small subunit methyltransferase A [Clostridia bacterium]|nr:ribosomal RNA small subunit methyltransferase A [Clostridia bacterium]